MDTVGSFEAKTHLPKLLERVSRGEKITITKRGKPEAMLVPPPSESTKDVRQVVNETLEWRDREGPTLGEDLTIRDLIEEGRR
ncbi:MAG: type II toxin-antitoxin system prevent-host-death family antitoxin [Planctomycetaceae bacterium]|nr:type II toxin-antitoxin system prevent-host-death family antitoxin [Planctomycetaceae bacterium]